MKIYILKLKDECWYIGKTNNPSNERILQHLKNEGSEWTKLHPVIDVEKIIENCDEFDEDKYVKMYMALYGIDKVRGGNYSFNIIDVKTKVFIEREINHARSICFICNRSGHLSSDCYIRKKSIKVSFCKNCGQYGHHMYDCYNKPDIIKLCYKCNKGNHEPKNCYSRKDYR